MERKPRVRDRERAHDLDADRAVKRERLAAPQLGSGGCKAADRGGLTYPEVQAISALVQSKEHRHMSIRALALHAQRVGEVLAHPATWGKLIRRYGWGRPRLRMCPDKPTVGLRAAGPNVAWVE